MGARGGGGRVLARSGFSFPPLTPPNPPPSFPLAEFYMNVGTARNGDSSWNGRHWVVAQGEGLFQHVDPTKWMPPKAKWTY